MSLLYNNITLEDVDVLEPGSYKLINEHGKILYPRWYKRISADGVRYTFLGLKQVKLLFIFITTVVVADYVSVLKP